MPSVDEIFERVKRTAQMPYTTNPNDLPPLPIAKQRKQFDTKRVKYVQYQEAVLLTLESIRRSSTIQVKLLKELLKRDEKDDILGEVYESRIILPPGRAVMQIDFLGADHSNFDPTVNLSPGDDLAIPIHPIKQLIIYNKGDATLYYSSNPRFGNLQKAHSTVDPGDLSNVPSRPHNIARVNLLNKDSTSTAIVKLIAIV